MTMGPFEKLLMEAILHNGLKPPDFPFDPDRYGRATHFADRVMLVVGPHVDKPGTVFSALTAAAYVANATLTVDEDPEA
jgi:hypothetical protein